MNEGSVKIPWIMQQYLYITLLTSIMCYRENEFDIKTFVTKGQVHKDLKTWPFKPKSHNS